ncbi:MAG TPA: hypothetical protein VGK16_12410 [Candidatus Limnocylindrales bacterium]
MTHRASLVLVALAIALAGGWIAPLAGIGNVATASAAATDLTLVTDTVYEVQPDAHRVHVTMTVTVRNNTRETKARKFWFDHAFLAVLPSASLPKISGTPGGRVKLQKRTRDAALLRIDFGGRLYSGKSRTFKVAFDLVDAGTPTDRAIRVGPSLVTLPVWAHASTGAKGGTVTVRIPAGYQVAVEHGQFATTTRMPDGGTELATTELAKPLEFFAYVSAQKPAQYTETALVVQAGGQAIDLRLDAWSDDAAWATRVGDLFARSLPVLREEIGLPLPATRPLTVRESANRSSAGYAALFDPGENRIEVAYWADHAVVIHEAAHAWFNGALLADRWANEGFASLYAERAAAAIKEAGSAPAFTDEPAQAAIPLNAWAPAAPDATGATTTGPTDQYANAASFALASAIAERAGDDTLRAVWARTADRVGAYQPATTGGAAKGTPETLDAAPDWRGFLDILEDETGVDFTDLWRRWVVRPDEAALLDARAQARASYERTLALADGWALPRSIRDALRAWQFDTAERVMADTRTVLAQRTAVESMASQDGVTLPGDMRQLFEAGQLADASARAEAERNAMLSIAGAAAARTGESDPLTTIGMLGENPEADLAAARTSLAGGDLDATLASADDAFRAWNGAWQEGRRRALLLVAVVATIIVLGSALIARARAARRDDAPLAPVGAGNASGAPGPADAVLAEEPTAEELLAAATPPVPGLAPLPSLGVASPGDLPTESPTGSVPGPASDIPATASRSGTERT